jgi:HemY protein
MRWALWFVGLFGVAAALALFASGNGATVTLFWAPYRLDVSLNLVLLVLLAVFLLVHGVLRALDALFALPGQARLWRLTHQERSMHAALVEALTHLLAGRFLRARKAAELVLARDASLQRSGEAPPELARLRVLAHLLVAESAQALRNGVEREVHFQQALVHASASGAQPGTREAVLLRAVRWALEERDPAAALRWLDQLPQGVARRTVALRLRLKVARLAGKVDVALETTRLLAKHRAFTPAQATGLLRALACEWVATAQDTEHLTRVWQDLEPVEQALPEVACTAAGRWLRCGGDFGVALQWLTPVWERMVADDDALQAEQMLMLVRVMENALTSAQHPIDTAWLSRIEHAQRSRPGDALLQYLAGVACLHLELWGKARQLITQAIPRLEEPGLQIRAWHVLAEMAQRQGDEAQAAQHWKTAAELSWQRSLSR